MTRLYLATLVLQHHGIFKEINLISAKVYQQDKYQPKKKYLKNSYEHKLINKIHNESKQPKKLALPTNLPESLQRLLKRVLKEPTTLLKDNPRLDELEDILAKVQIQPTYVEFTAKEIERRFTDSFIRTSRCIKASPPKKGHNK